MNLYFYSLSSSGIQNSHSLTREAFDVPKNKCACYQSGDLLIVKSNVEPKKFKPTLVMPTNLHDKKNSFVKIKAHIAFDNRGRAGGIPKRLTQEAALAKFLDLTGLERTDSSKSFFIGCHLEKKFNIHNAFNFEGWFKVNNFEKFNVSIENGVGSRKSYGYGLILVSEQK
ncbi:MAG: type I-E CRISPR-associated protein Cas6/Cse3/CasE [Pseudobdellovibrio sp.]